MTYKVVNGRLVRTASSMELASRRAVLKTPTFNPLLPLRPAHDVADEKWLSRSRPYSNKGRNEATRRVLRMNCAAGQ